MKIKVPIVYREELREYDFGPGHPFRGDRYDIIAPFIKEKLVEDRDYVQVKAEPVGEEDLDMICDHEYIVACRDYYRATNLGLEYGGNIYSYLSGDNIPAGRPGKVEEAARLIVGQAKKAADLVASNQAGTVVVLGGGMHHAKANYGEGFCIYNDVAFCARYLRKVHGLERVLVLDTDAHAGNGTAEYFYEDPSVLLIDLHQDPRTVYPGTGFTHQIGSGDGMGFTVNVPMPLFSGGDAYQRVFKEIINPVAEEFRPQVIIRNGGSDPHAGDQLTNLSLAVKDFRMIGEQLRKMSDSCGAAEIDLIGSGYNRDVLPHAWLAIICGLVGLDVELEEPVKSAGWSGVGNVPVDIEVVIDQVKNHLREYWKCLRL